MYTCTCVYCAPSPSTLPLPSLFGFMARGTNQQQWNALVTKRLIYSRALDYASPLDSLGGLTSVRITFE